MTTATMENRDKLRNGSEELINDAKAQAARGKAMAQGEMLDFVADVEDLVKKVAHVTDADVTRIRVKIEDALGGARQAFEKGTKSVRDRTNAAATATDEYVREKPWTMIGVAAAIGVLIGFTVSRR